MESIAKGMQILIEKVLIVRGECPECGGNLYGYRSKNKDGSERCAPTCMKCGFYDLKRKEDIQTERIYNESLKNKTLNFFKFGSVITDKSLFDCSFDNYKIIDVETETAVNITKSFVEAVLSGEPKHLALNGKSGSGKSHLAMAATWEIIKQSDYDKKCLFISYRELLEQIKYSFNDEQLRKEIQGSLMKDIKTADLVVIDDLGSELGGTTYSSSTNFNNDTLNSILEARQNQAIILTTNLTGKEMKNAYGERIVSRLFKNSKGFAFKFVTTADKRLRAV
ncbi:ATP-binding protein [Enterococcus gallinarum]|uniref:ATP-binding protein n=1 Tax=Enterococcus gallinarum TaxID=1353 RepID=UPI000F4F1973|nr:ATP-binding protein [Enterococcus gallinarum]ROY90679.1 ATP-binding protein [Enterococcus gallinarum]